MKPNLLWLSLLLQTVDFTSAETPGAQHVLSSDTDGAVGVEVEAPKAEQRAPGSELVDLAWVELRKIDQPLRDRSLKTPGIVGTLLQLATKAFPMFRLTAPPTETSKSRDSPLARATELLEESAAANNSDALYLLAEMNFYGNFSHARNFKASFDYYKKLASVYGNSSAQHMVGLMYSTGVGGAVERDQARALLYYTFAANQGHTRAEMTVAHRYHAGISVPKSCDSAVKYYKRVADKAIAWYRSGPPGGMGWVPESFRITDETGGVYGEGASVSSSGINAVKAHPNSDAYASIEDIIEYLDLISQKGDFKASYSLGRLYYEGQRGLPKNFKVASHYFLTVTQKFWKKNNRIVENYKPGLDKTACKAAGFIGRMYLRGEGFKQNFALAKVWFERGITYGDAQSQFGLGLLYLHGYGVEKNMMKALNLFRSAADHKFSPALVQLGALYLDQGHHDDLVAANQCFETAARDGNMEAIYYIAEMSFFGVGRDKSCSVAVSYYKIVAERAEPLVSSWAEANLAFEVGDKELALLEYLTVAEQGYEKAQNNVAYLLDPEQSRLPIPRLPVPTWLYPRAPKSGLLDDPSLALIFWTRSSRQGNIDALVKMGDYYLYGIGTNADVDKAVQCYTGASEYHQSAQALYNLGWMHENGMGLNQDYHLAKRYYDQALETNDEAYLPVTLSLLKLRARSAWNTLTNGRINSIQDEPEVKKDWSLSEWIANFMQDDGLYYEDAGYETLYEDDMPGGDGILGEIDDDGLFDYVLIAGLAATLVFLVFYRQQQQQAARQREEEARRQQQQPQAGGQQQPQAGGQQQPQAGVQQQGQYQGGFFPPPGDPNAQMWAAGGVGH